MASWQDFKNIVTSLKMPLNQTGALLKIGKIIRAGHKRLANNEPEILTHDEEEMLKSALQTLGVPPQFAMVLSEVIVVFNRIQDFMDLPPSEAAEAVLRHAPSFSLMLHDGHMEIVQLVQNIMSIKGGIDPETEAWFNEVLRETSIYVHARRESVEQWRRHLEERRAAGFNTIEYVDGILYDRFGDPVDRDKEAIAK